MPRAPELVAKPFDHAIPIAERSLPNSRAVGPGAVRRRASSASRVNGSSIHSGRPMAPARCDRGVDRDHEIAQCDHGRGVGKISSSAPTLVTPFSPTNAIGHRRERHAECRQTALEATKACKLGERDGAVAVVEVAGLRTRRGDPRPGQRAESAPTILPGARRRREIRICRHRRRLGLERERRPPSGQCTWNCCGGAAPRAMTVGAPSIRAISAVDAGSTSSTTLAPFAASIGT